MEYVWSFSWLTIASRIAIKRERKREKNCVRFSSFFFLSRGIPCLDYFCVWKFLRNVPYEYFRRNSSKHIPRKKYKKNIMPKYPSALVFVPEFVCKLSEASKWKKLLNFSLFFFFEGERNSEASYVSTLARKVVSLPNSIKLILILIGFSLIP